MSSKLVQFNRYKHKKSTWITRGLLTPNRYRDEIWKQLKLTNPSTNNYETIQMYLQSTNPGGVAFIHQTVRFLYLPVMVAVRIAEIKTIFF